MAGLLYGQAHLLNTIAATATTGYLASHGAPLPAWCTTNSS